MKSFGAGQKRSGRVSYRILSKKYFPNPVDTCYTLMQNMNSETHVAILLSGGMDSAACAHYLQKKGQLVHGIFIDYGQKAALPELNAAERLSTVLGISLSTIQVKTPQSFGAGEISGRNAFLVFCGLLVAGGREGLDAIALGIHAGTPYYDCSPAFLEIIGRLVAEYTDGRTRVAAPFIDWTKQEIFEYCTDVGIPIDVSYSCESGETPPCGSCLSCRDRRILSCLS
jgi:7-cyano-7-deazaguanine synthase